MKKKTITTTTHEITPLITELRGLIQSARHAAATTVNTLQVLTNFEIGRRIVEHEQKGEKRAEYGAELLKELSARLTEEFGKGFSERNLRSFRTFYLTYQDRCAAIWQKASAKLPLTPKDQTPTDQLTQLGIFKKPSAKSPFTLSWSHYVLLLTIKNPEERSFYEIESTRAGWSLPELKRQVASCLYERFVKTPDENPTIGILLCKKKKEAIVELTLPADANIHAKEYQLYLPSKEVLRRKLLDWLREQETGA